MVAAILLSSQVAGLSRVLCLLFFCLSWASGASERLKKKRANLGEPLGLTSCLALVSPGSLLEPIVDGLDQGVNIYSLSRFEDKVPDRRRASLAVETLPLRFSVCLDLVFFSGT